MGSQTTMAAVVAAAAAQFGDLAAFVEPDGATLSFRQFAAEAAIAAGAFIAAGVQHGDRLAVWAPNSTAWIVAGAAMQMIGAVLVPLNTRFKAPEAAYILGRTRPRLLLTVGEFLGTDYVSMLAAETGEATDGRSFARLASIERVVLLDDATRPGATGWTDFRRAQADPASLSARIGAVQATDTGDILFTSGTTGTPKGAMHSQGQMFWMVDIWNRCNDLRAGDRQLVANPFFHSFGYRSGWVSGLMAGMTTWPVAMFDPARTMELIQRARITVLMGSPTLFYALLDHADRGAYDLSSLRVCHTGAANVPLDLIRRLREELGFDLVLTSFGQTESTALITANRPDADFETIAGTVGKPLPGVEVHIAGAPLADRGEILVRGPNVMQGYFEDPAATAETIDAEGWLHTGDVGQFDGAGNLRILDRIKDVVIVGGFNAYPAEIENALRPHPAVADVAVFGTRDSRLGEVCVAAVVLQPGATLTLPELTAWARERVANYKVPRHLLLLDALPRNALGKILKFVLRAQFESLATVR